MPAFENAFRLTRGTKTAINRLIKRSERDANVMFGFRHVSFQVGETPKNIRLAILKHNSNYNEPYYCLLTFGGKNRCKQLIVGSETGKQLKVPAQYVGANNCDFWQRSRVSMSQNDRHVELTEKLRGRFTYYHWTYSDESFGTDMHCVAHAERITHETADVHFYSNQHTTRTAAEAFVLCFLAPIFRCNFCYTDIVFPKTHFVIPVQSLLMFAKPKD